MWPFDHSFATYTWPGLFGWVAHNCPGNMVAGFLQVGIGIMIGYGLKKTGVIERAKQWAMRDLHAHLAELHDKVDTVMEHHEQHAAKLDTLLSYGVQANTGEPGGTVLGQGAEK